MADPVTQAAAWSQAMLDSPYRGFKARVFYSWDEGLGKMPVAGPGGGGALPAEVVRLGSPVGCKVVAFFGRRVGKKPANPPREPNDANQVFRREWFVLDTEDAEADGGPVLYTFAGWKYYDLLKPVSPDNGDSLPFYHNPALQGSATNNNLTPGDLDPSITGKGNWQRQP